jgi:hypothetical protein
MNELLKVLADQDRELEAPAAVEMRLRGAFKKRYAHRKWPYFAIAAAIVAAVFLWPKPQTIRIAVVAPPVPVLPAFSIAKPVAKKVVHRKQPKEVMTAFYSLLDDAPPFEHGELLRVNLTAAAMRSVGLPVSEEHLDDPVLADVLVGEEGLARAIRFVRYER